jgi:hypothetical protein
MAKEKCHETKRTEKEKGRKRGPNRMYTTPNRGAFLILVGSRITRCSVGTKLGGHKALIALAKANLNDLPRPQLSEAEPAERLHVDEYIFCTGAARQESETFQPIEPFDHGSLPIAFGNDMDVGALGQLRGVDGRTFVHLDHSERLKSAVAPQNFAYNSGALIGSLIPVPPQNGDMNQNVGKPAIGNDEAKTLGDIEPLYVACYYKNVYSRLLCYVVERCDCGR